MTILALFEVAYRFLFFSVFHDDVSDFKLIIQWVQGASGCSVVSGGCQWIYVIKSGAANGRWTVSQWVRNVLLSCPVFARSIFISSEGDGLETSWWRKLLVAVCLSCLCSCFSWEPFQGSSLSLLFQKMSCFVPVSCCSALSPIPNKPLSKSMVIVTLWDQPSQSMVSPCHFGCCTKAGLGWELSSLPVPDLLWTVKWMFAMEKQSCPCVLQSSCGSVGSTPVLMRTGGSRGKPQQDLSALVPRDAVCYIPHPCATADW